MNTATKLLLLTLSLLVLSASAIARDSHQNSSRPLGYSASRNSRNSHDSGIYLGYSNKHNKHHKKRNLNRSYGSHDNAYQNSYNDHSQKACHLVTKKIVDDYGHYKNVGSTMCYDSDGKGYIVSGSRFLKH